MVGALGGGTYPAAPGDKSPGGKAVTSPRTQVISRYGAATR